MLVVSTLGSPPQFPLTGWYDHPPTLWIFYNCPPIWKTALGQIRSILPGNLYPLLLRVLESQPTIN